MYLIPSVNCLQSSRITAIASESFLYAMMMLLLQTETEAGTEVITGILARTVTIGTTEAAAAADRVETGMPASAAVGTDRREGRLTKRWQIHRQVRQCLMFIDF